MKQIPNQLFFAQVEAELAEGRSVRFRLKGISMTPLLRNNRDEVVVYPCRANELKRWDVVLFRYRGNHVLHRIISKEEGRFIMRGDGVWGNREVVRAADIIGVVRQVRRPSGKVVETSSRRWRWQSRVWCAVPLPLRRILLRIYHALTLDKVDYTST